jgi:hypothetical protein
LGVALLIAACALNEPLKLTEAIPLKDEPAACTTAGESEIPGE